MAAFKRGPETCGICGVALVGMGHNPDPVPCKTERCCGHCNDQKVLLARMALMERHDDLATLRAALVAAYRDNLLDDQHDGSGNTDQDIEEISRELRALLNAQPGRSAILDAASDFGVVCIDDDDEVKELVERYTPALYAAARDAAAKTRLAATAPELLEALKRVYWFLFRCEGNGGSTEGQSYTSLAGEMALLHAAIAKATGTVLWDIKEVKT